MNGKQNMQKNRKSTPRGKFQAPDFLEKRKKYKCKQSCVFTMQNRGKQKHTKKTENEPQGRKVQAPDLPEKLKS